MLAPGSSLPLIHTTHGLQQQVKAGNSALQAEALIDDAGHVGRVPVDHHP
jgi:hypothetical protein